MPQAAEVCSAHRFRGLDLYANDSAGRMLQNDIDLYLVTVAIVKELHWLIAPSELPRDLADDKVLQ